MLEGETRTNLKLIKIHGLVARVVEAFEDLDDVLLRDVVAHGLEEEDDLGEAERAAAIRVNALEELLQFLGFKVGVKR